MVNLYILLGLLIALYFWRPAGTETATRNGNVITIPYKYKDKLYKVYIPYNSMNASRGVRYLTPTREDMEYHPGIVSPITAKDFGYSHITTVSRGRETIVDHI
jgi:hypothetical protein